MIREIYHPKFSDDLALISKRLGRKNFHEFLIQLDRAIEQVIKHPLKSALLKYQPLQEYRKKKLFSSLRPSTKERPDVRLIYRFVPAEATAYFLSIGFRITQTPHHPQDIYQRSKNGI